MAMGERREESRRLQVNIHVTVQMMDFDAAVDLDSMTMGPLMLAAECEHLLPRKNHTPVFFIYIFRTEGIHCPLSLSEQRKNSKHFTSSRLQRERAKRQTLATVSWNATTISKS